MARVAIILGILTVVADARPWLVRHQSADGSWGHGSAATRVTGLAVLAFLNAGYTDRAGSDHRGIARSVHRGLRHLLRRQKKNGRMGEGPLLGHAVATVALCDVWRLTKNPRYRRPAQRALRYLEGARLNDIGWTDPETVAFCVMALKSGMHGGLEIDVAAFPFVRRLLDTWKGDLRTAAVGVLLRRVIDGKPHEESVQRCLENLPSWDAIDMPFWFLGSLALFQEGGNAWKRWNEAMKDSIVKHQHPKNSGDKTGSWDAAGRCGRAEATALMLLCLGLYYHFDATF